MKIIVTGGAGFIGSHITEALCNNNHKVIVVDNLTFGHIEFVDKRAQFIHGDVGNIPLMKSILKRTDAVIHLAGSSIIQFSYQNPTEYYENNVLNGIHLLEAMRSTGVKKIIFSSTAAVYGSPQKIPIKEEEKTMPLNAYGASKLAFEEILCAYYFSYGITSVSLRYFNAYGSRDEQVPASRAVPMWMKAILRNQPIERYWHGKQIRDYIHVTDIASAHLAVLNLEGLHTFNIGSGKGIVMDDMLKTIEKIGGKKVTIHEKGERAGDPHELVADTRKIQKELGWKPKISLFKGLTEAFVYYDKTVNTL